MFNLPTFWAAQKSHRQFKLAQGTKNPVLDRTERVLCLLGMASHSGNQERLRSRPFAAVFHVGNVALTTALPSLGGRPKRSMAATTGKATKNWQNWRCPFGRRHHETCPKRQPIPIPVWDTKEESTLGPAKRSIIEPIPPKVMARYFGLSQDLVTEMTLDSLIANPGSSDREPPNNNGTSTVTLQFVWMPRYIEHSPDKAREPINLLQQRDDHTRLSAYLTHQCGEHSQSCPPYCPTCTHSKRVNAQNVLTHRPVWTGSIFRVTRPTDDIPKFQRMIEIQWAIVCAAVLSGRAQDIELQRDRDDDDAEAAQRAEEKEQEKTP
ncbi:hypothetical protein CEP52_003591 [Fusarium oligoseptatum]|uniref:Uncharacterized protein n=1 Tax=Fusarium oligoseptatum TaxID=2604345 RepID=A0A428U801_9HYPO|nr:hypothetical protein CEP52_003591 [Fusarium oligoseptatum]